MLQVAEMIRTHPHVQGNTNDTLINCIEECYACAQACTACADACLGEEQVKNLLQCIRLNLDCADVCAAAGSVASRRTGSNEQVIVATLRACEEACRLCGDECQQHAEKHEHCRVCAEACGRCAESCRKAIGTIH